LRRIGGAVARIPVWARWVALAVALVLVLVLFVLPWVLVRPKASVSDVHDPGKRHELEDNRLKLQNDVRTTLLQGLGGLAVLAGAVFAYRQLQISREGQVTERFNTAIGHLGKAGDDNMDVRLGAIYALERIAKTSEGDREAIAEILTAYVRIHAAWRGRQWRGWRPSALTSTDNRLQGLRARAPDVQAVMTVLGRRVLPPGKTDPLLLTHVDLREAGLIEANLEGADLRGANLERADLRGANLCRAHLEGANLGRAHLETPDPSTRIRLREEGLIKADLQGADLRWADLEGADLRGAHLRGARLEGANLGRAHLETPDPSTRIRLREEGLIEADLEETDLRGANLQGADLGGANLQGADLRGANLEGARCNADTVLPTGFDCEAGEVKFERS
jgi:uncharacterized protein YjbI with pentapeptide repeats